MHLHVFDVWPIYVLREMCIYVYSTGQKLLTKAAFIWSKILNIINIKNNIIWNIEIFWI